MRDEARGAPNVATVDDEQPGSREPSAKLRARELVETVARDGNAEQEEPDEQCRLVRVADSSQVRGQLGRPREELVARREPPLDSLGLVPGGVE